MKTKCIFIFFIFIFSACGTDAQDNDNGVSVAVENFLIKRNPVPNVKIEKMKGHYFLLKTQEIKYKNEDIVIYTCGYGYDHIGKVYILFYNPIRKLAVFAGDNSLKDDASIVNEYIENSENINKETIIRMFNILIQNNTPIGPKVVFINQDSIR